jgi:drug/metabolite transporter (DMT)-like permease
MTNFLLYLATAFIWGSTWLAIKFQLGTVHPTWSVAYRFALAAILLFLFCLFTEQKLRFTRQQHLAMALQGLFLFSLNYIFYYIGSQYFISGLVAVIFASIIIMNIINTRIFFGTPLVARVITGALIGLAGLTVVFSSQFKTLNFAEMGWTYFATGLGICALGTFIASLGNMVSVYNQKLKLPILQSNAFGMAYGAIFVTIIALIMGYPATFDSSFNYVSSLLYLTVFGSIVAFGTYLQLLGRIGADRAAYAFVLLPVIALALSTAFEGFNWTMFTCAGIGLVLFGNYLVLTRKKTRS